MTELSLHLDTRREKNDGTYPIKFYFFHKGSGAYISTGLSVTAAQWDDQKAAVVHHPSASLLNNALLNMRTEMSNEVLRMRSDFSLANYATPELKAHLYAIIHGKPSLKNADMPTEEAVTFFSRANEFIARRRTDHTKSSYVNMLQKFKKFETRYESITFEEMDRAWLKRFVQFLEDEGLKQNSLNLYLMRMRAVFSDAIDDEVITHDPFRKLRLKQEATRKRSLSVEELRKVMFSDVPEKLKVWQDTFKLIFLLIGINVTDLYNLGKVRNGRVEYVRAKTGKQYSILVLPEAKQILLDYKGAERLLNSMDEKSRTTYYIALSKGIKKLGEATLGMHDLTSYWARHSWATIASEIDIPKETISQALGHSFGSATTEIYIKYDMKKVDQANRKVIDYVFYPDEDEDE